MKIKTEIKRRAHFNRYIFGSAVYSNSPKDLDVAIIYDNQYVVRTPSGEPQRKLTVR